MHNWNVNLRNGLVDNGNGFICEFTNDILSDIKSVPGKLSTKELTTFCGEAHNAYHMARKRQIIKKRNRPILSLS